MPYRQSISNEPAPASPSQREELISYTLFSVAGALPVAHSLCDHASLGAEATIGLFMLLAGVVGLLASARAAWIARTSRHG
jgi:hypothetical protein